MLKDKSLGRIVVLTLALSLMVAAGIYAADMPDVMQLEAPYPHKKGAVTFPHLKHVKEYKITCGECHHDDKGKPLTDLKEGDSVKKCIDCHSKPGELKGRQAKGLSDKELLEYHANAMHQNCVDCHKKYNKEKKEKKAPQSCKDCHPKEKE